MGYRLIPCFSIHTVQHQLECAVSTGIIAQGSQRKGDGLGCVENVFVKILSYPGLLMQRITTVEPTDDIIEVAIESIKAVITDNPEDDMIK